VTNANGPYTLNLALSGYSGGVILGYRKCVLRIHFTADDLSRVRIMPEPDPLWEVLLSLHLLQTSQGMVLFDGWRRRARATVQPSVHILTRLARSKGYSPDFLTPAPGSADLDDGLEILQSTERARLRADMGRLAEETALPTWAASVADGSAEAMRQIAGSIRDYYSDALKPYWPTIRAHIRADRNRRAEMVVDGGTEALLGGLSPTVSWNSPVLEVTYPVDDDLYLEGRGLTLLPSFFCWQNPITLADRSGQPVLVYPVERTLGWSVLGEEAAADTPRPGSLVALLGRTRAAVLRTIADTPSLNTSELARMTGISLAGASQHTTVLREAGLVVTRRHQGSALHKLSPRGATLLNPR
jgi:DNA-binding transcriptional ArsR family regulator